MKLRSKSAKRAGATAVEFAIVFTLVFMVIIGIFEYARLIFIRELAENATRDGARQAIVTTNSNPDIRAQAIIQTVTSRMAGMVGSGPYSQLGGYTVSVYTVDSTTRLPVPGTIASGAYDPTVTTFSSYTTGTWFDATFGQGIGVQVSGTYYPLASGLIGLQSAVPISFRTVLSSEAN